MCFILALTKDLYQSGVISEGPANKAGKRRGQENPFSSGWYDKRSPEQLAKIKSTIENWSKKFAQTPSEDNAWKTYAKARKSLKGARYSKKSAGYLTTPRQPTTTGKKSRSPTSATCFTTHSSRATSGNLGITVYEEFHVLSEMIQWIWRGEIRDDQPIKVFIPSDRMRGLFIQWLNSTSVFELIEPDCKMTA